MLPCENAPGKTEGQIPPSARASSAVYRLRGGGSSWAVGVQGGAEAVPCGPCLGLRRNLAGAAQHLLALAVGCEAASAVHLLGDAAGIELTAKLVVQLGVAKQSGLHAQDPEVRPVPVARPVVHVARHVVAA